MKHFTKLPWLLFMLSFISLTSFAQTTEVFEDDNTSATTFNDNGQNFTITNGAGETNYDIEFCTGCGWNGSAPDNKFIDNSGTPTPTLGNGSSFTISTTNGADIYVNNLYLFMSQFNLTAASGFTLTIQGRKNGVLQYTITKTTGFSNTTTFTPNNGFTFINFVTEGGSNNSTTLVDELIITTTGNADYLALDAMNWTVGPLCTNPTVPSLSASPTTVCPGGSSTLTITGTLNDATQWSVYTGSCGGTLLGTTATSSFVVTPAANTTYFVRGEGGCVVPGSCSTIAVNVSTLNLTLTSQTNVSCNAGANGAAAVTATGGAGGYTYNWTPGNPIGDGTSSVSGLTAGAWTCTVTDANLCTRTANVTITQPSAITSSISTQTNVSCNGGANGSATVSVGGGTPGYTYSWSPSGGTAATITGRTAGTYTCTITDANGCTKTQIATITQPSVINSSISAQTNVACNGGTTGSATVLASGGTPGYTYSWSPSGGTAATATGLAAGTYTCTITDANSCIKTQTAIITQPGAIVMNAASQTNVSCNLGSNGAASVTAASNGTGPYTYNWTPGNPPGDGTVSVTGLTAGAWTCTVTDANGCTRAVNFTITQPSAITSSVSAQNNVSCNLGSDGGATVVASGGTPGYTYSWSPSGGTAASISGRTAGTYTCTITDANGCIKTQTVTITQPTAITSSISAQINVSCNGGSNGSAMVSAAGGTPGYTYSWSPSGGTAATITGRPAGTYTCTITDANGCIKTQTATITQPTAITSSISSQTNVSCNAGSNGAATVLASGGTPGYTYSWSPSGGTAATITGRTAGTYTCTITDANGCIKTQAVTITQPSAITSSISAQTNVACNGGATGSATVLASGGTPSYTYSWSPSGGTAATASGLAAGPYICTITDANGCTKTQAATITQPSAITMTLLSSMNPTCGSANGAASMNPAAGGTPGYTYNWTPGNPTGDGTTSVTGLSAGTWTCTVTDANGCTKATSVTITSTDVIPPIAVCQNFTTTLNGSGVATITAANINNGSSDNCGAVTLSASQTTFTCANLGSNIVTLTATDGNGNTSTCVGVVTVIDNTPPSIICPGNQTGATNAACNFTLPSYTALAIGTDNCGGVTLTQSPAAGTVISANTLVTITATDGSGNASTCTFNVILNFSACVGAECTNAIVLAPLDPCGGQTSQSGSTVGGTTSTETSFCGTSAGSGGANWYTFTGDGGTWTASTVSGGTNYDTKLWIYEGLCGSLNCITGNDDFSGVQSQASFATTVGSTYYVVVGGYASNEGNYVLTVSNVEGVAPVPNAATLPDVTGVCEITSLTPPTATDNCSVVTVTNNASLPITIQGTSVVTWTYTDASGNSSTQTQNVILTDVTAPVADLSSLADVTAECEVTSLTNPTATDNCGGTVTVTNDATLPISGQGTTVVTWTYTDEAGNSSVQTQNVVITDATAPVADLATLADVIGDCEVTVLTDPTATDNCGGTVTVTNDATLPISTQGTTVVTWTYDDGNGNTSTQTQNIVIDDFSSPIPMVASLPNVTGACSVNTPPAAPMANDACSGMITGVLATSAFPYTTQGTYIIVWTYDDGNGNIASQSQNIVVSDVTAPAPNAGTLANLTGDCSIAMPTAPTATDNCSGAITGTTTTSFPITAIGSTTIVWTYDDGNGNVSTQTQVAVNSGVDASATLGGDGVTITATTAGATYAWINCDFNTTIADETGQSYTPPANGNYAVMVTVGNCSATSPCITVSSVGIDDLGMNKLTVYPNPSESGYFTVSYEGTIEAIDVVDVLGRIIELPTDLASGTVNGSELAYGRYMVRVTTEKGVLTTEIVIAR